MPKFSYKAKEGPAKVVDGVIDADSADSAVAKIIQLGLAPLDVREAAEKEEPKSVKKREEHSFSLLRRVGLKDLVLFTRQMTDLVEAAVPILRSLQLTVNQTRNPHFKTVVRQIYESVRDGGALSEALAKHPRIFPALYVQMVRAGELSGQLELIFRRLAEYLEKEQETRAKIRSSLAYPALVLTVGVAVVFLLLTFFIPKIVTVFEDLGQSLPAPTILLMNVSGIFADYWWLMLGVLGLSGFYARQWVHSPKGRQIFDAWKLRAPVVGHFVKVAEIGRFARTLGTLLESGVNITTALKSVGEIFHNVLLRAEIQRIAEEVAGGTSLSAALKDSSFFPDLALNMIAVGEETGRLEKGLYKIADSYEREADQASKTMLTLLGPLVLIGIIVLVGFVFIALLLPILQMNTLIE